MSREKNYYLETGEVVIKLIAISNFHILEYANAELAFNTVHSKAQEGIRIHFNHPGSESRGNFSAEFTY